MSGWSRDVQLAEKLRSKPVLGRARVRSLRKNPCRDGACPVSDCPIISLRAGFGEGMALLVPLSRWKCVCASAPEVCFLRRDEFFRKLFSGCVRTDVLPLRWNEELENAAPEGRTNLAQRFSAGKSGKNDLSPGGTTQFSRTHFSAAVSSPKSEAPLGARHRPSAAN